MGLNSYLLVNFNNTDSVITFQSVRIENTVIDDIFDCLNQLGYDVSLDSKKGVYTITAGRDGRYFHIDIKETP